MRAFLSLVLFIALFILLGSVAAQEATPPPIAPTQVMIVQPGPSDTLVTGSEPISIVHDDNPYLLAGLGVLAALLIALSILWTLDRHKLAEYAREIIPKPVLDELLRNRVPIETGVDSSFSTLQPIVASTPNTLDDMLLQYGREGAHDILDSIFNAIESQDAIPAPESPAALPT